jgi:hypothetical protein
MLTLARVTLGNQPSTLTAGRVDGKKASIDVAFPTVDAAFRVTDAAFRSIDAVFPITDAAIRTADAVQSTPAASL